MEESAKKTLMAGFYRTVITPPMGLKIPGYYSTRYADGVLTDLYINATAFSDGEKKAVVFSLDAITPPKDACDRITARVAEHCDMDAEGIYLHTPHSHTAFRLLLPNKLKPDADAATVEDDPVYADFFPCLVRKFCDCAQMAFADLKPCTFKIARGEAKGISFNRRYEMKDGTFKTNPQPAGDPNILRAAGPVDESVQLLRIVREGGSDILMINYGNHADTVGGTKYCADWPGFTADYLRSVFDGNLEVMIMNGAEGDINHVNRFIPSVIPSVPTQKAERIARILAGEVLKLYDDAVEIPTGSIRTFRKTAVIGRNPHDPDAEPLAMEINRHYQDFRKTGVKDEFLLNEQNRYFAKEDRLMSIVEASRIVQCMKAPEYCRFELSGLQIGGVGFVGIPGEPFAQIGMDIKADSKLDMTFVNCLVNGSNGYVPSADAFAVDGYERNASKLAPNCAQLVTEAGLAIRAEMEA